METCTFCGRTIAQVGRMVVSPIQRDVFICDKCSEIVAALINGEINKKDAKPLRKAWKNLQLESIEGGRKGLDGTLSMTPSEIHRELDKYVIGQEKAKKIL